jgi:hypothetical protein
LAFAAHDRRPRLITFFRNFNALIKGFNLRRGLGFGNVLWDSGDAKARINVYKTVLYNFSRHLPEI